ncbi:MAG: hypothetical protein CYPHOPRED_005922 [Cyphobasidiales sp. Tagirdzhanova-0007]|nr:MAG: hypothetical protein CYPHOPRED_005922 [Cyphobasidiales sp. Tagirdzhanova-0007]
MDRAASCSILIVGGGVFGLSTALSLAQGRFKSHPEDLLVLDRSATPPEEDAASSDLNKIVRGDYCDPTYADLAQASVDKWTDDPFWKPYFHKSGIVVAASALGGPGESYVKRSFEQQQRLHETGRSSAVPKMLSDDTLFASAMAATPANRTGKRPVAAYRNGASGWAWSRGAMDALFQKCRDVGIRFAAGQVNSLIIEGSDVRGARTMDGREFRAEELVVLAAGSWTPAILPDLTRKLKATGQVLATIQLTQEEAEVYKRIPVYIDMQSGFYMFPPNDERLLKVALHLEGYINEQPSLGDKNKVVSLPRTGHFQGSLAEQIPKASVAALRLELGRVWPDLGRKPFQGTRMCWYCDTQDNDFLIGYHDTYSSLFLATGGSGHAFKFLPVMGDLCLQAIEGTLPAHLADMWSFSRERREYHPDRQTSKHIPLDVSQFAQQDDLKAHL